MTTALITGASAGLGEAFSRVCARRGDDLVLVARNGIRLTSLAEELSAQYGTAVEVLVADLSVPADRETVAMRLRDPERPVDLLINNAGFGLSNRLLDATSQQAGDALAVMVTSVAELSRAAAPTMIARGHGKILNVASLSAWITQGEYSAIKSWVKLFTEGLSNELVGTGVTATALCPGWVRTEFHSRAGVSTGSIPNWIWVDAQTCARKALSDTDAGKPVSIPTLRWKAAAWGLSILPRRAVRAISRRLTNSRE